MRCDCCNRALNDYESTLKHGVHGYYMNTCLSCLKGLEIPTVGNPDFPRDAAPYDQELDDEFDDSFEVDDGDSD